jgi:hypothetical protein
MTISIVITNLPADGGSPITGINYRINGGSPISLGATAPGTYATAAALGDNIDIQAVNGIGPGPWSSPPKNIPALGFFPALFTQAFADNSGNQTYVFAPATGTGLTFTYALTSPPAGVTINGATRTITFDTNAMAPQSGTIITVTATDNLGRAATGSPRTFALTIGVGAVNPVLSPITFADPGNATADTLTAPFTYAGTDTLRAFVAIRNGGAALTAAQLAAGTGTFLERVVINPFSLANFDLTGFTATSNAGTAIDMAIAEVNNGGISDAQTVAVSGLDFTVPTFSSGSPADGATGVAVGSNIALTFSENVFAGSGLFRLRNTTANTQIETFNPANGTGSSGGTISIAGAVVTLNPFADLLNSTDYAVRWDAGALLDQDGNSLGANTGDTLYNFTTAASASVTAPTFRTSVASIGANIDNGGVWTSSAGFINAAGQFIVITAIESGAANYDHTVTGSAVTSAVGLGRMNEFDDSYPGGMRMWLVTTSGASTITVTGGTGTRTLAAVAVYTTGGLTATGQIFGNSGRDTTSPVTASVSLPTSNYYVLSLGFICRYGTTTTRTWGGSFAAGDKIEDRTITWDRDFFYSLAWKALPASGTFNSEISFGTHNSDQAAVVVVALLAA